MVTLSLREKEDAENEAANLAAAKKDVHPILQGTEHGQEALPYDGAIDHGHEHRHALAQTPRLQGLDLRGDNPSCHMRCVFRMVSASSYLKVESQPSCRSTSNSRVALGSSICDEVWHCG